MDLGLSTLTDDQCLGLLQEVLGELATRDPIVRQLAQQEIISESEKLDIAKAALQSAVDAAKREYTQSIYSDIDSEVRRGVLEGTIRLMGADEEARAIAEAHIASLREVTEAAKSALRNPSGGLQLRIDGSHFEFKNGSCTMSTRHSLTPRDVQTIINAFESCAMRGI